MPTLRDRGALACALAAAVPALALTTAIEAGQLFVAGRVVSGLDVEAETFGAVLGALAAWQLADRAEDLLAAAGDVARSDPRGLGLAALASYLVVHAFFPFDVTIDPGVVFVLLAGLLRSWLGRTTPRCGAGARAFSLAVGVLAGLELGKVFFVSRSPDVANAIVGVAGAAFGALVPPVILATPTPWIRRAALAPLSVALLAWAELTPFAFALSGVRVSAGVSRIEWLPFVAYFYGDPRRVLLDLGDKALLSGFVALAVARLARRLTVGVAVAGLSGLVLEAAQVLTPARTPSVTDVVIFIAGGFIGSAAVRRLDARVPGRPSD